MKLYAWRPKGHGEASFFVMAENEDEARKYVEAEIAKGWYYHPDGASDPELRNDYSTEGWGTEYYTLTTADVGKVIINDND